MARVLATLHVIGATLALVWLLLPHSRHASELGVLACIASAYLVGALLFARAARTPPAVLRIVTAFAITFVISGAIYFSHASGSAFGLFYLWATLYIFFFFTLTEAALGTLLVAVAYGVVLLMGPRTNVWGEDAVRWALTLGTAVVSGVLVRALTEGVRRSERRFRHGLEVSSLGIALVDEEGRFQTANPALCELVGISAEELLGMTLVDVTNEPDRACLESRLREIRTGQARSVQLEQRWVRTSGDAATVLVTLSQLSGERPFHALVQVQDITDRRAIEEALRSSEEHHRLLFERNPQPMWLFDPATLTFLAVNQAAIDSYGYSREEFLAMTLRDIRPAQDIPALELLVASGRADREAVSSRHRRKDGSVFDVEVRTSDLPLAGRDAKLVLAADVTERTRAEITLRHQAEHDTLTDLLNRRSFEARLVEEVERARASGGGCSVLVFDIDDLKYVNDSFGHAAGDSLLRQVAASLRRRLRSGDVIARIGGDEFAVLLPGTNQEQAERIAGQLLEHLRSTVWHGLRRTTASIGVASFDDEACGTPDLLLTSADVAMYEAKDAGRDRVVVSRGRGRRLAWVEEIRDAIDSGRLVLHSQPILDLRTGVVAQEELLVRMDDGQGGLIPPGAFIPAAERFGLIHEIDRWVVARGVELARAGRRVEVNLSAHSIGDRHITQIVAAGLESGASGENLIFEITETAAAANFREAQDFAERLSRLGCGFALDDFGTGFGSFSYLKHVPATYLKIDMEFVRELATNPADRRVVKAIVSIAEGFGQRTIAEGVEDATTLELLRDFGVHYAQGYYVGRPAPVQGLEPSPIAPRPILEIPQVSST
jgi:diguanylate cyclase (GGDEF)-like protein/PAS domain S-box-containing protein